MVTISGYRDNYTDSEVNLVYNLLGDNTQDRFDN